MPTFHLFARTEWAQPLTRIDSVEAADTPDLGAFGTAADAWLEAVVIPASAMTWVLKDGDLVAPAAEELDV
jgi:hypothetical protein